MNYLIMEGKSTQKYNATSKAREDINVILLNDDFNKLELKTSYKRYNKKYLKLLQVPYMVQNSFLWLKTFKNIKNSNIIIQYPILNSTLFYHKILRRISKENNVILLIHDLDSLRGDKVNNLRKEDIKNLNSVNYIICHNESMKYEIQKMGISGEKIICLEIFDYLYKDIDFKKRVKSNEVIIAGNLSPKKVKYIQYINEIGNVIFNLYGVGFEETKAANINYKGKFLPEELLNNLDGSFGLIWDGETIDGCTGEMGNYLRYNNPHKLSLYMAAGVPVIAWKKAAIANFILENNVGFLVDSLTEISNKIEKISSEEYEKMMENCKIISKKLKEGFYTQKAIKIAISKKG